MRDGPYISPEDAALEAFAEILAKKRGGTWVPVRRLDDDSSRQSAARVDPEAPLAARGKEAK